MTTATATSTGAPPRGADLVGRALLALCALSTAVAFADGVTRVAAAPAEWALTESWRTAAYLVFAGMWALLAARPRSQRGMWELIVLHKVLVTVQALLVLNLPGAGRTAWVDGALVAATVTAWVLCRGRPELSGLQHQDRALQARRSREHSSTAHHPATAASSQLCSTSSTELTPSMSM